MFSQKHKVKLGKDDRGLVLYAYKCPVHGWFIDYVHGFSDREYVTCGKCEWPKGNYSV